MHTSTSLLTLAKVHWFSALSHTHTHTHTLTHTHSCTHTLTHTHSCTHSKTPHDDLRLENESLKDIIEQYKRSLCSLDGEVELHKLHQKEHERRIMTERR